jgi:phosphinothricin acetyltransferase
MNIRSASIDDASGIADIYNHYVLTSHATFELEPVDPEEMARRVRQTLALGFPFLIALDDQVAGYSYGRPFRPRPGYRHAVEVAVYVHPEHQGAGIATKLYKHLFPELVAMGSHTLVATIALPNEASVSLHERFGFAKAGHFREVGRNFDRWIDVGYWQLLLENACTRVGDVHLPPIHSDR